MSEVSENEKSIKERIYRLQFDIEDASLSLLPILCAMLDIAECDKTVWSEEYEMKNNTLIGCTRYVEATIGRLDAIKDALDDLWLDMKDD